LAIAIRSWDLASRPTRHAAAQRINAILKSIAGDYIAKIWQTAAPASVIGDWLRESRRNIPVGAGSRSFFIVAAGLQPPSQLEH
jgi:hypothetical protein